MSLDTLQCCHAGAGGMGHPSQPWLLPHPLAFGKSKGGKRKQFLHVENCCPVAANPDAWGAQQAEQEPAGESLT